MVEDNSEIYSSDEEDQKEFNEAYEKKVDSTECENKQNPHEEEDFSVILDVINQLLRCKDCVVEEYQENKQ